MTARKAFKCDVCSATLYGHNPEMFDTYWDFENNNPSDPRDYENCRKNLRRGDLHWKCPVGHEFQGSVERMLRNLDDEPCPVCKKGPPVEPADTLSALDSDLVNSLCPVRNRRFGDISELSVKSDMRLYWDFGGGNVKRLTVEQAIEVFAEVKKNRKRRSNKKADK